MEYPHISCRLSCGFAGTDAPQWFYTLEIKATFKSHWSNRVDCLNPQDSLCVAGVSSLMKLSVSQGVSSAGLSPGEMVQLNTNKPT